MGGPASDAATQRPLPSLNEVNAPFWTSGSRNELVMQRCERCRRLVHPPAVLCPHDHGDELEWEALSGRAHLESWTVNHHQWFPGIPAPYVIAFVTPVEDARVRILTNLLDVGAVELRAGLEVEVAFEEQADDDGSVWLPFFRPVAQP